MHSFLLALRCTVLHFSALVIIQVLVLIYYTAFHYTILNFVRTALHFTVLHCTY